MTINGADLDKVQGVDIGKIPAKFVSGDSGEVVVEANKDPKQGKKTITLKVSLHFITLCIALYITFYYISITSLFILHLYLYYIFIYITSLLHRIL